MNRRRLILHAANVHTGGGLVLLKLLLGALRGDEISHLNLDRRARGHIDVPEGVSCRWFEPTLGSRFGAELELRRRATPADVVLCLGSLPPLFRLRASVAVFVQNRLVLETDTLNAFDPRTRWRIRAERAWLGRLAGNADRFVVQTPAMSRLLVERLGAGPAVTVLPFGEHAEAVARRPLPATAANETPRDFLYVASGDAHKNHARLIGAWRLLAGEGIFPTLCLTLEAARYADLRRGIEETARRFGLKIEMAEPRDPGELAALYRSSRALIFPSTVESLGLPLIEARRFGLPVIAGELDYVRDVLDPEESFDPRSEVSIARAVKRFLNRQESPLEVVGARHFLDALLER